MYYVTKIDDSDAPTTPASLRGPLGGLPPPGPRDPPDRLAPHDPVGRSPRRRTVTSTPVLHSFEFSLYVFSGASRSRRSGRRRRLDADHCIVIPLGTDLLAARRSTGPCEWLQMASPAEIDDGRRQDTFFTGETLVESSPMLPDMRDPRNRNAVRFDADSMDLRRLAGGVGRQRPDGVAQHGDGPARLQRHRREDADRPAAWAPNSTRCSSSTTSPPPSPTPTTTPSRRRTSSSRARSTPWSTASSMVLHPGDVLWAGVGADHGFENRGAGLVRWIEVQAPQPPARHSYRFSREWEHLAAKLDRSG